MSTDVAAAMVDDLMFQRETPLDRARTAREVGRQDDPALEDPSASGPSTASLIQVRMPPKTVGRSGRTAAYRARKAR